MKAETEEMDATPGYFRPSSEKEALQVAIEKWVRFQYQIWKESKQQSIKWMDFSSAFMRIVIIVLSAAITTMSNLDGVPKATIAIVGGVLTVLAGIEGYLKLADRKVTAENRQRELLSERDRWGYKWMVEVELETNTEKALIAAKRLLQTAPLAVNDSMNKYLERSGREPSVKPKE